MKQFLALGTVAVLSLALTACGDDAKQPDTTTDVKVESTQPAPAPVEQSPATTPADQGSTNSSDTDSSAPR